MTQKYEKLTEWETRGGWRAVVVEVLEDGILRVWHKEFNEVERHLVDGQFHGGGESDYDLLRPWVEKRSGWVNVYEESSAGGHAEVFDTQEQALSKANSAFTLLACVKWTEGDGV